MARITGKDLYIAFGSMDMSTDFQEFETSEEGKLVEVTAGDDANASYATTYKDGSASYKALYDGATGAASGSAVFAAVAPHSSGTLTWGPKGTASGNPKFTAPVLVSKRDAAHPYAGAMEVSVEFQFNGAVSPTTW